MPKNTPKVLVVNDDRASLLALTTMLDQRTEDPTYKVMTATSGTEALRQVLLHDFAVILLDVNMPGMNGFETAEAIQQRPRSAGVPIIFVTAFLSDDLARLQAYGLGAADYIFTPVIPQILQAKISVFAALAEKNEQLRDQAQTLAQRSDELTAANDMLRSEIEEREAAERENDAKDEFLAMLSHELRNPLSAIASASSLLSLPNAPSETRVRAQKVIQRQAGLLGKVVDKVLDLSRAMSGKIVLIRQTIDLSAVIQMSLDEFTALGRTTRHQIETDLSSCLVDGDAARLKQAVSNLIDNALKFTPPGGRIALSLKPVGANACLAVTDTGAGMPSELVSRVFDVFVQGARPLDRSQGGLGIGLSLVRCIAELHGGMVEAHSEGCGKGCTFMLRLPIRLPNGAASDIESNITSSSSP